MTLNRKWLGVSLVIAALTFAVYAGSLGNGFFILDDGLLIYENNAIRDISPNTIKTVFTSYDPELYIPLTFLSYQIDYLLGGYSPFIYHFTNLLLHTLNALLVTWFAFAVLSGIEGWRGRTKSTMLVALGTGVLFAVHPLHVETVVWASARKDVLSTVFFLGALVSYLQYAGAISQTATPGAPLARPYALSLILFSLGLLAKVTVLTLPVVLLLIDYLRKRQWNTRVILEKLPYFALSILFGIIALGGKADVPDPTTLFQKLLLGGKSALYYIQKLFLPFNLTVFNPQLSPIRLSSPEFFVPLLLLLLLLPLLPFLHFRGNPRSRLAVFGILFFLVTLAPSLITVSKGGNVFFASDRYAYIPSIGILLLVTCGLFQTLPRKFSTFNFQLSIRHTHKIAALGIIALLFMTLTVQQSLLWGNPIAFFTDAAKIYPDFYLPNISLGASYRKAGRYEEAVAAYRNAIGLRELPNTYGLIGQAYAEDGKYDEALKEFGRALLLAPNDSELHYGIGQVHALMKNADAALKSYERALDLMPDEQSEYQKLSRRISVRRDRVYYRMGLLYGENGEHGKAVEFQRKAIGENPFFADAHYNLAVGLGQLRRTDEAVSHYERAVALDPNHLKARVNLGLLYASSGRREDAREQLENVLRLDPGNSVARGRLQGL